MLTVLSKITRSTCLLLLCCAAVAAQTRQTTDMAGRRLTVPSHINRVYCMNPACALLIYNLAPEKLIGWPIPLSDDARRFLDPNIKRIPVQHFNSENNSDFEEIIRLHPDIVMFMANSTIVSRVERVQEQTHIPAYMINSNLTDMPAVFEQLGYLLGVEKQGKELAQFSRGTLNEIASVARTIPPNQRKRVYYAQGPSGLQTFPAGAPHAQPIDFVGAVNVASTSYGLGYAQVSTEQLLRWNPDVILAVTDNSQQSLDFYTHGIWSNPVWKNLTAVKNHAVYSPPRFPFNWLDPPWSSNRILGVMWLAQTLYPDKYHFNLSAETKDYYWKFYHRKLTDAEVNELLRSAK